MQRTKVGMISLGAPKTWSTPKSCSGMFCSAEWNHIARGGKPTCCREHVRVHRFGKEESIDAILDAHQQARTLASGQIKN